MINDKETFFKGVEVGRAMRGWRNPDAAVVPSGTTYLRENGTHDVARYAKAVVDAPETDDISAAQVRALCTGTTYHFPVFTHVGLRMWAEFGGVTEKTDGTADIATWLIHFEANASDELDTLGIVIDSRTNTIPGTGTDLAYIINTILGDLISPLLGFHDITFTDSGNAGKTGCEIHVYGDEDIEYVTFNGDNGLHIDFDETVGVQLTGDGWANVTSGWHGVVPVTFRVN